MDARVAAVRLDPERAVVVLVQHVLPREADAAEHLDRALDRGDPRVAAERLRGGDGERCVLVRLRDRPRRPVRERARQLRLDVCVREPVRHRLIRADRLAELLARLRVLDPELERLRRDADRLERERGELLLLRRRLVEELRAAVRAPRLLEQHGAVEEAELGELVATPAAVREHRARLAAQQLLIVREGELHQRLLGRPSTRSAMMLRRISLVPASIVLPRDRSCWWCQYPSSSPSRISIASFVSRWFCSDQCSFAPEPSGPGMPVLISVASARLFISFSAWSSIHSWATRSRMIWSSAARRLASATSFVTWSSSVPPSAKPSVPRSWRSVVIATCQPPPISPRRFSRGTWTSVKKISLNSASPVIWRSGRTSTPGDFMSTITYVSPTWRSDSGSLRPMRMQKSAMCANDDHTFCPFRTKWSSRTSIRVRTAERSEPAPGSEKPWHQISSAERIFGR